MILILKLIALFFPQSKTKFSDQTYVEYKWY